MLPTLILGALALTQTNIAQAGKYQIELRVPEEGLYAGEIVDVEFRVSDRTQRDPIEGFVGVPDALPTAAVTMPAMPGMPVARPAIHREGVPGDYGLELYFPHGGDFKIALRVAPKAGKPAFATFSVSVKDAVSRRSRPAPYALRLVDPPKRSGPVRLRLEVQDTKTKATVKAFDVSHTKPLHLILVSKDLGWFAHEHPVRQPDGSFVWNGRLPAGGDYLVFADVAPKDKGAQVLAAPLRLAGPAPTWPKALVPRRVSESGGVVATLQGTVTVGRSIPLEFDLREVATHRPVADLQPYLGAQGHLMIVHQDGATFVHSHPLEGRPTPGKVVFNARFPRPGIYKAWAQFQRGGVVMTFPFVFKAQ